jgi:hypothetical protein
MPKVVKKSAKNLKRKTTKRNDIVLAVLLGIVVTGVGLVVTRFSSASSNASFRRDPVTQMQGGKLVRKTANTVVRVAASPAPGVNPVYTLVSKTEMENTIRICIQYTVLERNTWINMTYTNAKKEGLLTSVGETKNPGTYTHCLERNDNFVPVDGAVSINVTPGSAQINKFYGVLRAFDD